MRTTLIFILVALGSSSVVQGSDINCKSEYSNRLKSVAHLSAEEFELPSGQGWRPLGKAGCYLEAANLLAKYSDIHGHHYSRSFHQARQWLSIDDMQKARPNLLASLRPEMPAYARFKWNSYVLAHIAYIDQDHARFTREMSVLEQDAEFHPNKISLKILRKIDSGFNKKFSEIFDISIK